MTPEQRRAIRRYARLVKKAAMAGMAPNLHDILQANGLMTPLDLHRYGEKVEAVLKKEIKQ